MAWLMWLVLLPLAHFAGVAEASNPLASQDHEARAQALFDAWSQAYGLDNASTLLPPAPLVLPPNVPPPSHLEDCSVRTAARQAAEERGEGGSLPAWARAESGECCGGSDGDAGEGDKGESGESGGSGDDGRGCCKCGPQPPWNPFLDSCPLLRCLTSPFPPPSPSPSPSPFLLPHPSLLIQIRGSDAANLAMTRGVQRDMWRHQFPASCTGRRLMLSRWPGLHHGMGSMVHVVGAYLSIAMRSNRTLVLIPGTFERAGRECEGEWRGVGRGREWEVGGKMLPAPWHGMGSMVLVVGAYLSIAMRSNRTVVLMPGTFERAGRECEGGYENGSIAMRSNRTLVLMPGTFERAGRECEAVGVLLPPHHLPITSPSPPHHFPITSPSPPHHLPITSPSPPHHLPITSPSPPHHLPITSPSPPHHLPITSPSPPHHLPITSPSPPHHLPITSPSPPHHLPITSPSPPHHLPSPPLPPIPVSSPPVSSPPVSSPPVSSPPVSSPPVSSPPVSSPPVSSPPVSSPPVSSPPVSSPPVSSPPVSSPPVSSPPVSSPPVSSPPVSSPPVSSPPVSSPPVSSPPVSSPPVSSPPVSSPPVSSPPVSSRPVSSPPSPLLPSPPSRLLPSRLLPSRLLPSRLLPSRLLPSRLLPSRLLPSRLLPSRLLPSRLLPSRLLSSHLITTYSPISPPLSLPSHSPLPPLPKACATRSSGRAISSPSPPFEYLPSLPPPLPIPSPHHPSPSPQDLRQAQQWECYFFPISSPACVLEAMAAHEKGEAPDIRGNDVRESMLAGDTQVVYLALSSLYGDVDAAKSRWGKPWLDRPYTIQQQNSISSMYPDWMMARWWRAQAVRFLLRWPSAHLCHVINRVRHVSYGRLMADRVTAVAAQQASIIESLNATSGASSAATSAASSAANSTDTATASSAAERGDPLDYLLLLIAAKARATETEILAANGSATRLRSLHSHIWPMRGVSGCSGKFGRSTTTISNPSSAGTALNHSNSKHPSGNATDTGGSERNDVGGDSEGTGNGDPGVGGEVQMVRPVVSMHVRLSDKVSEMELHPLPTFMLVAARLRAHQPDLKHVWLSTEVQKCSL
ncbi:unnamed protein product [Closterium sp. Yama58-4]|nr:unnamed protein product [Closterium sp. Yama58-4]